MGYVVAADGTWLLDPDTQVRERLRPIMGPQMRILFSLGGNLESDGTQQMVQIIHDPLI